MTKERREEVVLIALAASVAAHVGLMAWVRTQVMAEVVPAEVRSVRRPPMQVTRHEETPGTLSMEAVDDVDAPKDAPPAAAAAGAPLVPPPEARTFVQEQPAVSAPDVKAPEGLVRTVFDARVADGETARTSVPVLHIETPDAAAADMPAFASPPPALGNSLPAALPAAAAEIAAPSVSAPAAMPARLAETQTRKPEFKPSAEIYDKVDAAVVAEERQAVRALLDQDNAADLPKFVDVTMSAAEADGWRYFKVMVSPRRSLPVVPKDLVLVIDGSGSIGKDRFKSCRNAAKNILRTATNSGDRFNLVVFRNAFKYAFRSWQECSAAGFAAGDRWLDREAAHGRTDVFSTISSVLTLPRDPRRPLIALVVTDGDANCGVSDTAEILSRFAELNDGLVSVYMYGVKSSANRELIDLLTRSNRGESLIFDGWHGRAGKGMETLSECFRDPVLTDLRLIPAAGVRAEIYPQRLRNLYRGDAMAFVGRVPEGAKEVAFALKGINAANAYEGFFRLPFAAAGKDPAIVAEWQSGKNVADLTSLPR